MSYYFFLCLDNKIKSLSGIRFFISCITGTCSNRMAAENAKAAISYFICCNNSGKTNEETIFGMTHDMNLIASVCTIKCRSKHEDPKERLLQQLKQVLKVYL